MDQNKCAPQGERSPQSFLIPADKHNNSKIHERTVYRTVIIFEKPNKNKKNIHRRENTAFLFEKLTRFDFQKLISKNVKTLLQNSHKRNEKIILS